MEHAALGAETVERLRALRYDAIIEKHEGPNQWRWGFGDVPDYQFAPIMLDEYEVLLPIPVQAHANIRLRRLIPAADGKTLTLLLEDYTFATSAFEAGRLVVCDRLPGTTLYVAIAYHEMFFDDTVLWSDTKVAWVVVVS